MMTRSDMEPSRKIEAEPLSPEQLAKLFDVVQGSTRVVVHVGAQTGMRSSTVAFQRKRSKMPAARPARPSPSRTKKQTNISV
jgi:hypothetical protein